MKKSFTIGLLITILCSCQPRELFEVFNGDKTFTAVIEDNNLGNDTRTSLDGDGNVLWKKGDQVSIFVGRTLNEQYQVTDASDGKMVAELNALSSPDAVSSSDIDNNVAFYPYSSMASIAEADGTYIVSGVILPSTQNYSEGSFGNGTFPMAAVTSSTEDMNLKFKNVLGGIKLQLKGTATIKSIRIYGNNNEVLCGASEITVSNSNVPSINLTDKSAKTVTLDCSPGVQLDAETATPFVIALPPMTMPDGFTVIVTDSENRYMKIATEEAQTITRSSLLKMPAVTYEGGDIDYSLEPFTIKSTGSTSVSIEKTGSPDDISIEYSKNEGNWETYTIGTVVNLEDGEDVQFRAGEGGNAHFSSYDNYYHVSVSGTGTIEASGNIMSLLDGTMALDRVPDEGFFCLFSNCAKLTDASKLKLHATELTEGCYVRMFRECTSLTDAPELPATTLADHCYSHMFEECTNLTDAPELPATTLADYCYNSMFLECTSLTVAPELPATTLADHCYSHMFEECTNLTDAPELPATTLADYCYYIMFSGCTSLTDAPELPATTLADYCYYIMFRGCTSLTDAPELPATTLADYCYYSMFRGCTSLTDAPELPATTLADHCYDKMFSECTSLTVAPELPATTLADYCYASMFSWCTGLTVAPELPATTLADHCYFHMFRECTSLTVAPELPATTLADHCYSHMFEECTNLTDAPELPATTLAEGCYCMMFRECTSLTEAPELSVTTLVPSCYSSMFRGCTSLTEPPELPATTLVPYCYSGMFFRCTSLTVAPKLPATTLAEECYYEMFEECTNLTAAPELPATTLANHCYANMFRECTSLTVAPELPATTLADHCYDKMFRECISLTVAPELPATTLANYCYSYMFYRCKKLNHLKALFTTTPSSTYTASWLSEVSANGTFVKSKDALWDVSGDDGIPYGWTVLVE